MSKYIKQDDVFELVRKGVLISNSNFENVCKHIGSLPTIDIVHCGECKHNENTCINHGEMSPRCRFVNYKRSADDFCSYGERIDNE